MASEVRLFVVTGKNGLELRPGVTEILSCCNLTFEIVLRVLVESSDEVLAESLDDLDFFIAFEVVEPALELGEVFADSLESGLLIVHSETSGLDFDGLGACCD